MHIQAATLYALIHNYRDESRSTANEVFLDMPNLHLHSNLNEAELVMTEFLDKAEANYKARTNQRFQSSLTKAYSLVGKCTKETTPQEIYDSIGKYLENSLGCKVFSVSVHRDEGCLRDKETGEIAYVSEAGFIYDKKRKGYYATTPDGVLKSPKEYSIFLAKDINELKEKFTIDRNLHFHLEFSGVREDGSSLGVASVVDKHKRADEDYEFKLLNISRSGILRDFPKTATKLLNNELIKNGKEPIKNEDSFYEKDLSEFEPKKQDESFKYRTQYEIWAKKSGFENPPQQYGYLCCTTRAWSCINCYSLYPLSLNDCRNFSLS